MIDCTGRELNIGDKVVCSNKQCADLLIGEVVGFTTKKVRVNCRRTCTPDFPDYSEQLKYPYQVCVYQLPEVHE